MPKAKISEDVVKARKVAKEAAIVAKDLTHESRVFEFVNIAKPGGREKFILLTDYMKKHPDAKDVKTESAPASFYVCKTIKGVFALFGNETDRLIANQNARELSTAVNRAKLSLVVNVDDAFEGAVKNLAKVKRIDLDAARKILAPAFGK